jgi:peptide deformylase
VVYFVTAGRSSDGDAVPLTVLINPVLTPVGDRREHGWEGCLSVPGLTGLVPRVTALDWHALDRQGQPIGGHATGFHARVLQHECDHLDGVLYPARMDRPEFLVFTEELRRYGIPKAARALMPNFDPSNAGEADDT